MDGPLKERDWKYLRSIHDEMLHKLCADINRRAAELATSGGENPHKQYLVLYRYIRDADSIIADCFDDWRRSRLVAMVMQLRRHGLLTDEHVGKLSPEAQEWLRMVEEREEG